MKITSVTKNSYPKQPWTSFTGNIARKTTILMEPDLSEFKKFMAEKRLSLRMENVTIDNNGKTNIGLAVLQRLRKRGGAIDLQLTPKDVPQYRAIEPVAARNTGSVNEALMSILENFNGKDVIDKFYTKFKMKLPKFDKK